MISIVLKKFDTSRTTLKILLESTKTHDALGREWGVESDDMEHRAKYLLPYLRCL